MEALKSKVFSGIYDVTTFAQNQLKAQIMVDACTGELKDTATQTTGGMAEKLISPDNPASKYIMQEQCMLGKAVVGIGAVSLKTYFMLSTMANRMVETCVSQLKNKKPEEGLMQAFETLEKMSLNGPNGRTTIANTNLKKIQRTFLNLPPEIQASTLGVQFKTLLDELLKNQTFISAPEFLSGIISLAADNAKDLALPKLNATADLVDIYTTAAMIGISFKDISKIMTSKIFNWMTKAGYDDIFDDTTSGNKVKKMVDFALFKLSYDDADNLADVIVQRNNWVIKNNLKKEIFAIPNKFKEGQWERFLSNNSNIEDLITFVTAPKDGLIDDASESISAEAIDRATEETNSAAEALNYEGSVKVNTGFTKKQAYAIYRKLLNYKEMNNTEHSKSDLVTLSKIIEIGEEMTTIGQQGQINQGMKTNSKDFLTFKRKIENLVNKKKETRVKVFNKTIAKSEKDKISFVPFNMDLFLKDKEYQTDQIEYYEQYLKSGFNVLRALSMSPNFFNMSKLVTYANEVLNCSYTFRTFSEVFNKLINTKSLNSISENDAKQIMNTINDSIMYNFIKMSEIKIDLSRFGDEDIELYTPDKMFDVSRRSILELNTVENIASFKHIMESIIIPKLKTDPKYKNNSFVRDLGRVKDAFGRISFSLPIQMMEIDSEPSLQERYDHYLNDFNAMSKDSIYGLNLGSMFFLYNLVAYKNGYGQNSLTRIFEDLIDSKNQPGIISQYYQWIGRLDQANSNGAMREDFYKDVLYKIYNYSYGTKLDAEIDIKHRLKLNSDFTFDLPYETKLNERTWINNEAYLNNITTFEHIDPVEAIDTIAKAINMKHADTIRIITDAQAIEMEEPKARGFVKDGKIYLNKSKFNNVGDAIGVASHEIAHLVLAAMKVNPDIEVRQNFYKLIQLIKTDQETERYASAYNNLVGSDLYEEIIASKIGKLIANKIDSNSNIELHIVNNEMLLDAFDLLFDTNKVTLRDIAGSNFEQLIENFAGNLFSFSNEIKEDYINNDQHISAVKTRLYESQNSNYKLKEDCK